LREANKAAGGWSSISYDKDGSAQLYGGGNRGAAAGLLLDAASEKLSKSGQDAYFNYVTDPSIDQVDPEGTRSAALKAGVMADIYLSGDHNAGVIDNLSKFAGNSSDPWKLAFSDPKAFESALASQFGSDSETRHTLSRLATLTQTGGLNVEAIGQLEGEMLQKLEEAGGFSRAANGELTGGTPEGKANLQAKMKGLHNLMNSLRKHADSKYNDRSMTINGTLEIVNGVGKLDGNSM